MFYECIIPRILTHGMRACLTCNTTTTVHSIVLQGIVHLRFSLGINHWHLWDITIPILQSDCALNVDKETYKADKFIDKIRHLQQEVHEIFEQSNKKYKDIHDQPRNPHHFHIGDKVQLHLHKENLQGPNKKLCPLC